MQVPVPSGHPTAAGTVPAIEDDVVAIRYPQQVVARPEHGIPRKGRRHGRHRVQRRDERRGARSRVGRIEGDGRRPRAGPRGSPRPHLPLGRADGEQDVGRHRAGRRDAGLGGGVPELAHDAERVGYRELIPSGVADRVPLVRWRSRGNRPRWPAGTGVGTAGSAISTTAFIVVDQGP